MISAGARAEIRKDAARWLIAMDAEPNNWSRRDFVSWLRASPLHLAEFLDQYALWTAMGGMKPVDVDIDELRREAQNLVHWPDARDAGTQQSLSPNRTRLFRSAAASAILVVAVVLAGLLQTRGDTLVTEIGEQRSARLEDGSVAHLNTDTEIEIRFAADVREVRLKKGEAMFAVERDSHRPFRVRAGTATFEALGTQFNVRRRSTSTTISVVEGRVAIIGSEPVAARTTDTPMPTTRVATYEGGLPPPPGSVAIVDAGEQIRVANDGSLRAEPIQNVMAWRQRQLVFDNTPLSEVAAELARYNAAPKILIEDRALRERSLSGVFAADDPESLIEFLKHEGIPVHRAGATVVIGSRK